MILRPKDFLDLRFEFIRSYPNSPFCVGDVLRASKFEGEVYILYGDGGATVSPLKFTDHFRLVRWWEHRTIEQLKSIKYAKVVSDSNYYVTGDIVEVINMWFNNDNFVGGKNNILFDLKGHHFIASQLEPATKEEYDKFSAR